MQHLRDVMRWGPPIRSCQKLKARHLAFVFRLGELKAFSMVDLASRNNPELLNLTNKVDLVAQTFKSVTSFVFCNLIGAPRSWCTDPKRYRQSPRPSLRVFILKELNAAGGSGLACETIPVPVLKLGTRHHAFVWFD